MYKILSGLLLKLTQCWYVLKAIPLRAKLWYGALFRVPLGPWVVHMVGSPNSAIVSLEIS